MIVRLRLRGPNQLHRAGRRIAIWVEYFFLIAGLVLLAAVAIALADSAFYGRRLDQLQSVPDATSHPSQSSNDLKPNDSIAEGSPLAMLNIPRLHMSAPLLDGTDLITLNRGVDRITGTARPGEQGDIGIAGHRDTYFRGLRNIRLGDVIELKRGTGVDTYQVDRVQIVMPSDVGVLRPTTVPTITLVTCYPFYFAGSAPQRFVVTASLATEASPQEVTRDVRPTTSINQLNKEKK